MERIRHLYDQQAADYDRGMVRIDRWLFEDGRQWVCSRACGDVLEIAVGMGRNLPLYGTGVRLTGVDVSSAMPAWHYDGRRWNWMCWCSTVFRQHVRSRRDSGSCWTRSSRLPSWAMKTA